LNFRVVLSLWHPLDFNQRIGNYTQIMATTLGILAGILSALAIWVGYLNSQAKDEQQEHLAKDLKTKAQESTKLSDLKGRIEEANTDYTGTLTKIVAQLDIRDDKEGVKAGLKSDLETLEAEVKDLEAQLADYQEKLPDTEDVDRLIKNLKEAQDAIEKVEVSISQVEEENTRLAAEIAQQNDNISYNDNKIKNHTEFRAQEDLKGKVTSVFGEWGFVVIGDGDIQGVTPRSMLTVMRGDEAIGELQVKTSTNNASTADILFETFTEGDHVQVGDIVVAKPVEEAPVELELPSEPIEEKMDKKDAEAPNLFDDPAPEVQNQPADFNDPFSQ